MGKHGAHARTESRGRIKALGFAFAIALCAVFITGLVTQSTEPTPSAKTHNAATPTSAAAATGPDTSHEARAGYNGADYQKLKDAVQQATPNEALRIDAAPILAIDDANEIRTFNITASKPMPMLSADAQQQIAQVVQAIEEDGESGFVFLDLQSGAGIAYQAGACPYIASASKAPLAFYVLQQNDAQGLELSKWELEELAAAIEQSDNDAFDSFGFGHMGGAYAEWLESYGVNYDAEYGLYLYASARSLAAIWNDAYWYLQSGTDNARWLADRFANTNRSFIRNGVADSGARVWNKGGWIASDDMASTTDAGIIECDGRAYLLAIVTGQPDSGEAQERVSRLARLLFAARDALA
ncbi:MAG: hypothetical protein Q4C36_02285 [Coriobacteriia bacterium]|nr:hypothetical protein [Coriobacteriia bacterium]